MKFASLVATCEGCGCSEIIQPSTSKRSFMLKFNRFIRVHWRHEFKKRVGSYSPPKTKSEQHKRTLRRMQTYGVTKQ